MKNTKNFIAGSVFASVLLCGSAMASINTMSITNNLGVDLKCDVNGGKQTIGNGVTAQFATDPTGKAGDYFVAVTCGPILSPPDDVPSDANIGLGLDNSGATNKYYVYDNGGDANGTWLNCEGDCDLNPSGVPSNEQSISLSYIE